MFNKYYEKLFYAIEDPTDIAISFQVRLIIDVNEQIAITDSNSAQTKKQRTNSLLGLVLKRIDNSQEKLRLVVEVFYGHVGTKDIAMDIARDG